MRILVAGAVACTVDPLESHPPLPECGSTQTGTHTPDTEDTDSTSDTSSETGPTDTTETGTPSTGFLLEDPLRYGTLGGAVGGSFGPEGWTVTANTDRIYYTLPRLTEGSVEFTLTGATMDNFVLNDNEIFALYEGGHGMVEPIGYNPEFRENHYKIEIRVYGRDEVGREGLQKLMWGMCPSGAPGYGACGCNSFFEEPFGGDGAWDGSPQRLRVEWGSGITRYLRNGAEILAIDWSGSGLQFGPSELHFSLGTPRPNDVGTAGMPIGATFSDVVVEGTEGELALCP